MNHIFRAVATGRAARPLLASPGRMPRRAAPVLLLLLLAVPAALRAWQAAPAPPAAPCEPEGRGRPPRHWLGCRADPGPPRALADEERLLLGLPLDPNRASARALAFVPGLSARLARAVAEDRAANGPFPDVEALDRVPGIGPVRLARARAGLEVGPPAVDSDPPSR